MKYILTCTVIMVSALYAQSSYTNTNNGKIDMHGGKSDKIILKKNNLSNGTFTLGGMGLQNDIKKTSTKPKEKKINKIKK